MSTDEDQDRFNGLSAMIYEELKDTEFVAAPARTEVRDDCENCGDMRSQLSAAEAELDRMRETLALHRAEWAAEMEAARRDGNQLVGRVAKLKAEAARVGICGDRAPTPTTLTVCDLPAGHAGWHGADNLPQLSDAGHVFAGVPSRMSWSTDEQGQVFALAPLGSCGCDLHSLLAEELKDPQFAAAYLRAEIRAEARAEGYERGRAGAIADLRARHEESNGLLLGYASAAAYLEAKGHQP